MSSPNLTLMQRYGTSSVYLEKLSGRIPLASRLALNAAGYLVNSEIRDSEESQILEAARMNAAFREFEEARMLKARERVAHTRAPFLLSPTRSPGMLSGSDVPVGMDEGMVRLAHVMGRTLAHVDIDQITKEAGIGTVLTSAAGATSKALSNVSKGFTSGLKRMTGQSLLGQSAAMKPGPSLQAALNARASNMGLSSRNFNKITINRRAPGPTKHGIRTRPAGTVSPPPKSFAERSGMGNGSWKWKLPVLGAAGFGLYGVSKGVGAATNFGKSESPEYSYGGASGASGVNAWGVPDRTMPYMGG